MKSDEVLLGIDIGTTNIGFVIINANNNSVCETYTVANISKYECEKDFSECDAEWIVNKIDTVIKCFKGNYTNIKCIGITGQMHGVLYVDKKGRAVSPLYTWQDERANRIINNSTYCKGIFDKTGYTVFPGYGFATLYYNKINRLEPNDANSFCTITDYLAMRLTKQTHPVMHPSNAASLGLFNITNNCFDEAAIRNLRLSHLFLPEIFEERIVGKYEDIQICIAIGDNQASFFGSVCDDNTSVLANFGTGGQISAVTDTVKNVSPLLEIRPYIKNKYLLCGCSLCSGRAYSILEKFFHAYANLIVDNAGLQYDIMNKLAIGALNKNVTLKTSVKFCGTRQDLNCRGIISEIDETNFTPENLVVSVLKGMADELKEYYDLMNLKNIKNLIMSGNAVKKNPALKLIAEQTFGLKAETLLYNEEAAMGAALLAGIVAKTINMSHKKEILRYRSSNDER